MRDNRLRLLLPSLAAAALGLAAIQGCEQDSDLENAAEDTGDALEDAAEDVDDAVDDAADDLDDMTDDD